MSGIRTIVISTAAIAAMGLGYGMWSVISPGEERRKEMLKVIPCSSRNVCLLNSLKGAELGNSVPGSDCDWLEGCSDCNINLHG
uniref:Ubiquinol-cytochrome-c reductase complex assembly factor 3 n=1 Tax=Fundulus heteroclitus TaxID=8078 RepID=A0A3Q2THJ5_FUNHE